LVLVVLVQPVLDSKIPVHTVQTATIHQSMETLQLLVVRVLVTIQARRVQVIQAVQVAAAQVVTLAVLVAVVQELQDKVLQVAQVLVQRFIKAAAVAVQLRSVRVVAAAQVAREVLRIHHGAQQLQRVI
jgi:hypothetical protein